MVLVSARSAEGNTAMEIADAFTAGISQIVWEIASAVSVIDLIVITHAVHASTAERWNVMDMIVLFVINVVVRYIRIIKILMNVPAWIAVIQNAMEIASLV